MALSYTNNSFLTYCPYKQLAESLLHIKGLKYLFNILFSFFYFNFNKSRYICNPSISNRSTRSNNYVFSRFCHKTLGKGENVIIICCKNKSVEICVRFSRKSLIFSQNLSTRQGLTWLTGRHLWVETKKLGFFAVASKLISKYVTMVTQGWNLAYLYILYADIKMRRWYVLFYCFSMPVYVTVAHYFR